jgi:predicted nucleic acid-binding Zn ribbon protein
MPRWDLRCVSCGATTDHAFTNAAERDSIVPLLHCWNILPDESTCEGALVVLPAAPAFTLKGSGFYVNDYKKG